jgi:hypothetical protein
LFKYGNFQNAFPWNWQLLHFFFHKKSFLQVALD